MRILLITPFFYPHKGGSQQYAEELYFHIMKSDPSIVVDVICYNTDDRPAFEEYRGFSIYRIPCVQILLGQFAIPNYFKLFSLLQQLKNKNNYKFINSHTRFFENSWWTPLIATYFRAQSILTDHCAYYPVHPNPVVSTVARFVDRHVVPFFANRYDMVTVTNKATKKFVRSLKIKSPYVVYGGVNTKFFKPKLKRDDRTIDKIKKKFNDGDIIITFVGRMIHSKNPQTIVKVAKRVIKQHKNVYFIFAGNGELYEKLKKQKNRNVYFLGSLEKKSVANLLTNTDILVHPSTHHEGLPNVILEAGACGCAVVATSMGGTKEIVVNEKTGLLVKSNVKDIEQAVVELITDEKKRTRLQRAIRRHVVAQFDWKNIAEQFAILLKRI